MLVLKSKVATRSIASVPLLGSCVSIHPPVRTLAAPPSRQMLGNLKSKLENLGKPSAESKGPDHASSSSQPAEPAVANSNHRGAAVDSRSAKLSICGFELEGVSIAGQETCIIIPRCKVALDIGRCPQRAIFQQHVLITHGHLDHIGGLPFHVTSRNLQGLTPSKIIVPAPYEEAVQQYVEVANKLQGIGNSLGGEPPMEYDVVPCKVGQEVQLPSGFIARPFQTSHTVASQGYILYSQRKKLKAELQGRSQEEIRELRLAGQEVQETVQVPEIAFTGDTTSAFLDDPGLEDVFKAKLLIIEMSFIDDSVTVEQAREKGHMHIFDFVAHAHKFQNEAILFVHFSARYRRSEILAALNTWLPPNLRSKCVPFLNGFSD